MPSQHLNLVPNHQELADEKQNSILATKFETIHKLITLLENYKPIYNGVTEKQRLEHYCDVIQEDIKYIVQTIIRKRNGYSDE